MELIFEAPARLASGGDSTRIVRDEYSLCSVFIIINSKLHVSIGSVIQFDTCRVRVSFSLRGEMLRLP